MGFHHLLAGGDAERFDDFVEVSLHNRIELVEGQVNPVVGDAVLRIVVGTNSPRAVAGAHLIFALFALFGWLGLILKALKQDRFA